MLCVLAPFDQSHALPAEAVNTVVLPGQTVSADAEIVATGAACTVIFIGEELPTQPLLFVTDTVNDPAVFTTID